MEKEALFDPFAASVPLGIGNDHKNWMTNLFRLDFISEAIFHEAVLMLGGTTSHNILVIQSEVAAFAAS